MRFMRRLNCSEARAGATVGDACCVGSPAVAGGLSGADALSVDAAPLLITTVPFGDAGPAPLEALRTAGMSHAPNPLGRRLTEDEAIEAYRHASAVVADTEPITARVLEAAQQLRFIARVGIGVDSVDLLAARERGILVSHTPDPPAPAVAELTVALMIDVLRGISRAHGDMRQGRWRRHLGRRLHDSTVGIIGVGRIGRRVIEHLSSFTPRRILANDLAPDYTFGARHGVIWTAKEAIFREADVVSLHVPLTTLTAGLVDQNVLSRMKPSACLINTARGGIVVESALARALNEGTIEAAAIDTFAEEPYTGPLAKCERCVTTCHMGSMAADCRERMELEAVQEAIRFLRGEPLQHVVPDAEYDIQRERA